MKHSIVIVGGGTAGITVAAQLLRQDKSLDIAIIDPSDKHYYQPAWTLVGGGAYDVKDTEKPMGDYIPKAASWIRTSVEGLSPETNALELSNGKTLTYDYMVLCPGIQVDWDKIPGLANNIGSNGICSNYAFDQCEYTHECIESLNGGVALFTNPNTPIKCGGAPQKIMYLACDNLKKRGLLNKTKVHFTTAGGVIFGVEPYKTALEKVVANYGIETDWFHNLVEINAETKVATFEILKDGKAVDRKSMHFDMIHVTPPMSSPDFIKRSTLANAGGWIDVDKHTLRHNRFNNVFGLGDAAGTPNAKTGAAIRKQAPVVVKNLIAQIKGASLGESYNGYGSCPLVTGYGKLILAEFDYEGNNTPSFPFNQAKERWSMYLFKKHFLPWMYWNKMLRGTA